MIGKDVDSEIHIWQSLEAEEHNNQEIYVEIMELMKVLKDKEEELHQIQKNDLENSHNFDSFLQEAHTQEQICKKINESKRIKNVMEQMEKKGSKSKSQWGQKF